MKIAIGSDHGGVNLKSFLSAHVVTAGHDVIDVGVHDTTSVDYPDIASKVCGMVHEGEVDRAILVCGTGQGMAMAANKFQGIRAAVVSEQFSARMASAHNDARVLCLGERVVGPSLAASCVDAWLTTAFEGGRHGRRVSKIEGTWTDAE